MVVLSLIFKYAQALDLNKLESSGLLSVALVRSKQFSQAEHGLTVMLKTGVHEIPDPTGKEIDSEEIMYVKLSLGDNPDCEVISTKPVTGHVSAHLSESGEKKLSDSESYVTWENLESWQTGGMNFPINGDRITAASTMLSGDFVLVIDDLDALECVASSSKSARIFLAGCHSAVMRFGDSSTPGSDDLQIGASTNFPSSCHGLVAFGRSVPMNAGFLVSGTDSSTRSGIFGLGFYDSILPDPSLTGTLSLGGGDPSLVEYCKYRFD